MPWHLFLDDQRYPAKGTGFRALLASLFLYAPLVRVARTSQKAKKLCLKYGCPQHIDFDHDLGDKSEGSGHSFAHWLINRDMDMGGYFIPKHFTFAVHSQNPVGKANIEGLLNIYLARKKSGRNSEIRKLYQ